MTHTLIVIKVVMETTAITSFLKVHQAVASTHSMTNQDITPDVEGAVCTRHYHPQVHLQEDITIET